AFAEQVARLLPAKDITRRHAPGRALVILVAGEEVEEQPGVQEVPALALAERKHVAEQLLGLLAIQEVLLIGRALISVAGRDRDADAELLAEVEVFRDVRRFMTVEDRGIDVDSKTFRLGGLDRGHRAIEYAGLRYRLVVMLFQTIEVDREKQVGRRLEQIELLFQQQGVGAQRDELLARDETAHELADLLVDQRLAARDRHHRRSAFFSGIPALLRAHAPIEDGIRIVDLAATDARQVATKQRLQHQHEGITLSAKQLLLEHVPADTQLFVERNSHYASLPNVTNQLHRLTRPAVGTR